MWNMVLNIAAVLNWDHGPYLSAGNFQKSVEGSELWCASAGGDDELVNHLFDGICDDMDGHPPDWGTPGHVRRVATNLKSKKCFAVMTTKVKWTRWGSHHWALKDFTGLRHTKLMVCVVIVVQNDDKLSHDTMMALGFLDAPNVQVFF